MKIFLKTHQLLTERLFHTQRTVYELPLPDMMPMADRDTLLLLGLLPPSFQYDAS